MSVDKVRYLTKDQVVEFSIVQLKSLRKKTVQGGFVFPVTHHMLTNSGSGPDDSVRCSVEVLFEGGRKTEPIALDLPLAAFNALPTWPTHDSVADVPRNVVEGS